MAAKGAKVKGITIALDADVTGVSKAFNQAKADARSFSSEMSDLNKLLKVDPTNIDLLGQKSEAAKGYVKALTEQLRVLKEKQEMINNGFDANGNNISEAQIKAYNREIELTSQKLQKAQSDFSETNVKMKKVDTTIASLNKELKEIDKSLELDPTNLELLGQKSTVTEEKVKALAEQMALLKEKEEQISTGFDVGGNAFSSEEIRAFNRNVMQTEQSLNAAKKELSDTDVKTALLSGSMMRAEASAKGFDHVIKELDGSVDGASDKMLTFGDLVKTNIVGNLATDAIRKLSQELINFGKTSVSSAIEFESAFAGVVKTVDGTKEELEGLKDGIRAMALEIPAATTEIAGVAEAAGQLGIQTDNILAFSKVMIGLGEATNLSSEEAASSLAKFANITKMSQGDFDRLGSSVVDLGNNFATTEADIVSMGSRIAAAGSLVGFSEGQIMGLATALSSLGIEAEAGGTAVSKSMKQIHTAVETGSDKLTEYARISGMSAEQFKKAWEQDAAGTFSKFVGGLSKFQDEGKSAIVILDELGIKEQRQSDALLRLAGNQELLEKALRTGETAWNNNIALQNEVSQRYATTESQMQLARNALTDLGITIGDAAVPAIRELSEGFRDFAAENKDSIADFAGNVGEFLLFLVEHAEGIAASVTGIGAAFGAWKAIEIVGKASIAVDSFKLATTAATATTEAASASVVGLSTALKFFAGPLGQTALGLTLIAGVLLRVNAQKKELHKNLLAAGDAITTLSDKIEAANNKMNDVGAAAEKYKELKKAVDDVSLSDEERKAKQDELAAVEQQLIDLSDGLITRYSLESGEIGNQIELLNKKLEIEKQLAENEQAVVIATTDINKLNEENIGLAEKRDRLVEIQQEYMDQIATLTALSAEEARLRAERESGTISQQQYKDGLKLINATLREAVGDAEYFKNGLNSTSSATKEFQSRLLATSEQLKDTNKSYNENQTAVEKYEAAVNALNKKQEESTSAINSSTKALSDEEKEAQRAVAVISGLADKRNSLNDLVKTSTKETSKLEDAYKTLSKGETISNDNLLEMIQLYPVVAEYIAKTGDVTLQNGEILKAVSEQEKQKVLDVLKFEAEQLKGEIRAAKDRIETIKQEYVAKAKAAKSYYSALNVLNSGDSIVAKDLEGVKELEAALSNVEAQINAIGSIIVSDSISGLGGGRGGGGKSDATKALEDEKKAQEELLKQKKDNFIAYGQAITDAVKAQAKEQYDIAETKLKEELQLYKEVSYEEKDLLQAYSDKYKDLTQDDFDLLKELNADKVNLISQAYIDEIALIDKKTAVALSGVNQEIELALEELFIKNRGLYDEIIGIRNKRKEKTAAHELDLKQREEEAEAKRLAELQKRLYEAQTTEEIIKAQEALDEYFKKQDEKSRDTKYKNDLKDLETQEKIALDSAKKVEEEKKKIIEDSNKKTKEILEGGSKDHENDQSKANKKIYDDAVANAGLVTVELLKEADKGQQAIKELLAKYNPDWATAGKSFIEYFEAGSKEMEPQAVEAFYDIGENTIDGFIKGLEAKEAEVRSAVARILAEAAKVAQATLGIQSPSTVFRQIGNYVGEGFELGLEDSVPLINKAAESLGMASVYGVNNSFGGSNSVVDNSTVQNIAGDTHIHLTIETFVNSSGQDVNDLSEELGFLLKNQARAVGVVR